MELHSFSTSSTTTTPLSAKFHQVPKLKSSSRGSLRAPTTTKRHETRIRITLGFQPARVSSFAKCRAERRGGTSGVEDETANENVIKSEREISKEIIQENNTEVDDDDIREKLRQIREKRANSPTAGIQDFWNGVVEETVQIEWPSFQKVIGTTGVVLAVILGSSAVLLTVNGVLAQVSDKLFDGIDVQDILWPK